MASTDKFTPLLELLKAQSKDQVVKLCNDSIKLTNPERVPDHITQLAVKTLSVKPDVAKEVISSLHSVLKQMVFMSTRDPSDIIAIFPESFHKNLKELLIKIYLDRAETWQVQALANQVSLARLVDFDWRVDVKTASSSVSRMTVPTCLVQFELQDPACMSDPSASVRKRKVDVELTREKLETMLDGLGKIRDQLSSVARR